MADGFIDGELELEKKMEKKMQAAAGEVEKTAARLLRGRGQHGRGSTRAGECGGGGGN